MLIRVGSEIGYHCLELMGTISFEKWKLWNSNPYTSVGYSVVNIIGNIYVYIQYIIGNLDNIVGLKSDLIRSDRKSQKHPPEVFYEKRCS